jgi:hypothetical protein
MKGETTVALAKSGVQLGTGSAYNIELSNAYEAKLQENLIKYNSQVAANNKMEEANFARIRGTMARNEAKMAQIGTIASTGSLLYGMKKYIMPKIPTFTAKGSIEQLAGTTSNIQMGLNNTLAGALAPVTEAVVNFKIKENEVQNKTEALKLKNDYLSETSNIGDQINQDKILSVNKVAANKFLKEKNNALIEKYAALATTQAAKTMFTNSALADVSKQIFSLDTDISRNILVQADEVFIDTKEKLFSKAYLKGGIYKDTLLKDTQQLIIDSYKSRVTFPELETMLGNVKGEIDYFDGMKDVQQTPRAAFYALKDEKNYSDITTKQRFALIERASVVIREQLTTEWENHTAMIDAGKEPPEFNMKLAQEVFGGEVAEKMLQEESVRKDAVENTSLIMTSPQKDVNELVKNIIDEQYEMFGEIPARANEKYYIGIANTRNEKL